MSKFTPGPWIISDEYQRPATHSTWIEISTHDSGLPIVSCRFSNQEANAHLIAAAPDMYEALTALLLTVGFAISDGTWKLDVGSDPDLVIKRASMALLKAEGKS